MFGELERLSSVEHRLCHLEAQSSLRDFNLMGILSQHGSRKALEPCWLFSGVPDGTAGWRILS